MSLLRNDNDNTINFQRASCTLDGCVKIWTSRVDSVGTETGKLLSNLESNRNADDDDEDNSDNLDADPTQPKKKKANNRGSATTLAKDPSQLKNKKPELEFAVDPLFRKTCADFDEGGASGLLMNHLSLGIGSEGCMRVIFDASDSMGKVEDEDVIEEPEDDVDLFFLRSKLSHDSTNIIDI
jgi:condensin complex subunit 2